MDRSPVSPSEWRLVGFGTAVCGGVLALLAAAAGEASLAVQVGLRILGAGLAVMGVATALVGGDSPGTGGAAMAGARAAVLSGVGLVLTVAPGAAAGLLGP